METRQQHTASICIIPPGLAVTRSETKVSLVWTKTMLLIRGGWLQAEEIYLSRLAEPDGKVVFSLLPRMEEDVYTSAARWALGKGHSKWLESQQREQQKCLSNPETMQHITASCMMLTGVHEASQSSSWLSVAKHLYQIWTWNFKVTMGNSNQNDRSCRAFRYRPTHRWTSWTLWWWTKQTRRL